MEWVAFRQKARLLNHGLVVGSSTIVNLNKEPIMGNRDKPKKEQKKPKKDPAKK